MKKHYSRSTSYLLKSTFSAVIHQVSYSVEYVNKPSGAVEQA